MTENTGIYNNGRINNMRTQYNTVGRGNVSVSDVASNAAGRIGDAVAARNRRIAKERANAPIIVKKEVKSSPFPISFLFYALVVTAMLMFIAYSNYVVNELSYEIGDLKTEISTLKYENDKLDIELEKKYDLGYIEEVATKELGLVKNTEVVKHYLNMSDGDEVVVSEKASASAGTFTATFNTLKDSVAALYE